MKTERKVHDLTRIGSVGVKLAGDLDNIKFNFFMGCLLREKKEDLFRSKGVLSIHEQGDTKFVFQGVHETINFGPAATPWPEVGLTSAGCARCTPLRVQWESTRRGLIFFGNHIVIHSNA